MGEPGAAAVGRGWPSLGRLASPVVETLLAEAALLRLGVARSASGATVIDAGIAAAGGLEAGRRIAELCLGGAGRVAIAPGDDLRSAAPFAVTVTAADPVLACLASQYAGWALKHGEGASAWFALASGPGRARVAAEPLFAELGYRDRGGDRAVFVLEAASPPPEPLVAEVAEACELPAAALTFVLTPTTSLAGTVQIVARVMEVALHKAHALGFPLAAIRDGLGRAPLPPPAPDFLTAMGRTNDAVLLGGTVQLFVTGTDAAAKDLAEQLPASASRDFGRPFRDVFAAANGNFYAIDPMLFSPAMVRVTNLDSGASFAGGRLMPELLAASFGG